MSESKTADTNTKTVNEIDEPDHEQQVMQAIKDTQNGFEEDLESSSDDSSRESALQFPDFTIKVGMTVLEDKLSHTQFSGYKAVLTDERNGETVEYVGEHPADAVLGAIEEATDGVY